MGKWHTTSDRLPIACFVSFHKPIQTFHQIKVSSQHTLYDAPKAIALGGHFVPCPSRRDSGGYANALCAGVSPSYDDQILP